LLRARRRTSAKKEEEAMTTRATAVGVAAFLATAALAAGVRAGEAQVAVQPPALSVEGPPSPPAADRPLITNIPPPAFSIEGGAGLLGYISGTGRLGPAWNLRVTASFSPRFAGEANYLGAANRRSDDTGTLTYTTLDARVRYNLLLADQAPVQPYLAAGFGYAAWIGPGGAPAGLVIPVSLGVERMLLPNVKIGARLDVRPSFFEDLGYAGERNPPGGSTWALIAGAGGAF
jgi:hypothetical protein